jgi:hypothetical protein
MLRAKKEPDHSADVRPKLNITGIAKLMHLSRATFYRRLQRETFSLEGVPMLVTRGGNLYDMEGVFQKVFPSADPATIATLMYDFMQKHRGLVK